ncbi:MAG: transcriptional regulator [Thermoproteota archaeon]|uniref:Helix-turn-helix domain-containing protein n=1 Tax=Candidatus Methanodesulfokora washburnensis TaxID=2478471 RepID=A0A429GVE8_9CREN|nr:helix-turn-helix domain-containing protein [Candidatus Methanodesulfokores washburnensis]RSN77759.1 helix-turn-helix domain-containing protein [Candidatus Methanodesulfokores washburnensis]RZN58300.1 MAG: helix-turn-helix domain-containing protein [Candidatus Methanodesulfokores washburnensis]TDA41153.1 MAG: transcriptional regulator [Candidatus Korarchaeota archaeon]
MIAQPCELVVKIIIPCIRAIVARELVLNHNMTQVKVAEILGVTQGAVSQYVRGYRGSSVDLEKVPEIRKLLDKLINGLATGSLREDEAMKLVCDICDTARKKGVFCRKPIAKKYMRIADLICYRYMPEPETKSV